MDDWLEGVYNSSVLNLVGKEPFPSSKCSGPAPGRETINNELLNTVLGEVI